MPPRLSKKTDIPPEPSAAHQSPKNHWPLLFGIFFIFYYLINIQFLGQPDKISYSEFIDKVNLNEVQNVEIQGQDIKGNYRSSGTVTDQRASSYDFTLVLPNFSDSKILDLLVEHDIDVDVRSDQPSFFLSLLLGFLPWVFILAVFFWSSRALRNQMGAAGGIFSFGKSKAKKYDVMLKGPSFSEVAGLENAKQDLKEVINFLKEPDKYTAIGAKMPKGILMMGAPGTGKTLLAKATATEAGVPFFSVSGSEFIEMYVGVGASRVRDMFQDARAQAPSLIFIDEIDSVGRVRGTGIGGGNDEREQTLNQVLAEMDGFDDKEAVVVIAATNRPDVLDPALLRPGRFDRKVILEMPQLEARLAILKVHTKKVPLIDEINLNSIASLTVGFSGADLANLVNEAALKAARENRTQVSNNDFFEAREKVLMGSPRADLLNSDERERVACHEAGHAIIAYFSKHSDPLKKVSIIPRGNALGMTEQIPEEDRHNLTENFLNEKLAILLGGRCAEKLLLKSLSSGAADDLKQATKLARKMIAQWGMSEHLGPVGYNISEEHPFLGREIIEAKEFSEQTATLLDEEVRNKLALAENHCKDLLSTHLALLKRLVKKLLDQEVLENDELTEFFTA